MHTDDREDTAPAMTTAGIKTVLDFAIIGLMARPTNPVNPVALVPLLWPEVMMLCKRMVVMTNFALSKALHFRHPPCRVGTGD